MYARFDHAVLSLCSYLELALPWEVRLEDDGLWSVRQGDRTLGTIVRHPSGLYQVRKCK